MRIDSPQIVGSLTVEAGSESVLTGSFTGSFAGDGSGLTGVAPIAGAGVVVTGTTVSIGQDVATTSSVTFNEIEASNVTLTGTITAATGTFVYQIFESSSTIITSGSNVFGNDANDIQQITGSLLQSGSAVISGSLDVAVGTVSGSFVGDGSGLTGVAPLAGTGVTVTGTTVSIGQAVETTSDVQFDSLGIGTAAPGTTGLIRATNDVVAYYSSDKRLKDNIQPIEDALGKVEAMGGYSFDWNDKQEVYEGHDVGVIAQEVQAVLPELVETRNSGFLAVKYEKLTAVLIEAVKELSARVKELENK